MKIGAQLFTLRDYGKDEAGVAKIFERIAEMGYKYAQYSGLCSVAPQRLAEISKQTGVQIVLTHSPFSRIVNDTEKLMEEHAVFGAKHIGLGCMPEEYRKDADGYFRFVETVLPAARKMAENGFKFHYHNHHMEFEPFNGKTGMQLLMENMNKDELGFILDTYWVQFAGADPIEWIYKLEGRIDCLHLKDMTVLESKGQVMSEIYEGNMNFDGIFKASADTKIPYAFVEQDICQRDPFESLKISLDNIAARQNID